MAGFMLRFLIRNLMLGGMTGILLLSRRLFQNVLGGRMQYRLWFLLFVLLAVPFLPLRLFCFPYIFPFLKEFGNPLSPDVAALAEKMISPDSSGIARGIRDLTLSVNARTPSPLWSFFWWVWIAGCLAGLGALAKSAFRLKALEKAALPLKNREVRKVYGNCLKELGIARSIPIYSTAYLKSPVIVGFLRPRIYLPVHLITDGFSPQAEDCLRYMLLHELQHYKHRDALAGHLMNLARVLYWFNPFVRLALREMRNDREIACDASVLEILEESEYAAYAGALLAFAGKLSFHPFAAGLGGSARQLKRRILHIVSFQKPSPAGRRKSLAAYGLTALVLLCLAPSLSTQATEESRYAWDVSEKTVSMVDLSSSFEGFEGTFVQYDLESDKWSVYGLEQAVQRCSPCSTYKIYSALMGLEKGVITPEDSHREWDGTQYPFAAWNKEQDLASALSGSVNWYFQETDARLGASVIRRYLKELRYGNQDIRGGLSSYWLQSSLKISPVEQVELLADLYCNRLGFSPENTAAVEDALCLFSAGDESLYGKTGTGRVNGLDVNGWFVGFATGSGRTVFFAVNIQGEENANGSHAAEIALSVLSGENIWNQTPVFP